MALAGRRIDNGESAFRQRVRRAVILGAYWRQPITRQYGDLATPAASQRATMSAPWGNSNADRVTSTRAGIQSVGVSEGRRAFGVASDWGLVIVLRRTLRAGCHIPLPNRKEWDSTLVEPTQDGVVTPLRLRNRKAAPPPGGTCEVASDQRSRTENRTR